MAIKITNKDDVGYSYEKEDKYIVVNKNDRSLLPFVIFLPKAPYIRYIDGYGKRKENQYFIKPKYPYKLRLLEKRIKDEIVASKDTYTDQRFISTMWDELNSNRKEYEKEIDFIRRQVYYIRNGYWFYNYGKPTYITGSNYAYLTEWSIDDVDEVEYRERDREIFLIIEYIENTTLGYKDIDMKVRTLYGLLYPKHRRDGATHKMLSELYFKTIYHAGENIGAIQSLDGDDSFKQYSKLTAAFRNMNFYVKPLWEGNAEPKGGIKFNAPSYLSYSKSLSNNIEYAQTGNRKAFDGRKVFRFLVDEGGKTKDELVDRRWGVQKRTLATGGKINGLAMFPSTTADMEAENGALFENLALSSMHEERNKTTGQTKSGLLTIFTPACYGLEDFIDKFGFAVAEDPKEEDLWRLKSVRRDSEGKLVGARRFLLDKRKDALSEGTTESMERYLEDSKLEPLEFLESFAGAQGGLGFDIEAIKKRKAELTLLDNDGKKQTITGNYMWKIGNDLISAQEFIELGYHLSPTITNNAVVIWQPDPDGHFEVSEIERNPNQRIYNEQVWSPNIVEYKNIASSDSFTWLKKKSTKDKKRGFSLGSGAVFRRLSKEDKKHNVSEYTTFNFIVTYIYRPGTVEEYLEEMLMMCVFNNTLMFPESNIQNIEQWFIDRGFGGYLLYKRKGNGRLSDRAGFYSKEVSQDTLVKRLKSYSKLHIWKENHLDILTQMANFNGVDSLTKLDLLVSVGGCLLGDMELTKYEIQEQMDDWDEEHKSGGKKESFFDVYNY